MIRKQLLLVSLTACFFGTVLANEYRAPLVSERGPLRYDLVMKHDKWSIETWTAAHSRVADRGFLEHGTDAKSLPAVIFGKEIFTIGESFQQNNVILNTGFFQNQNPYYFLTHLRPVASYTDQGMTMGARFEYPVFENKGRFGVRAAVPFKTVSIERDDQTDCPMDGADDAIVRGDQARLTQATGATAKVFSGINRYKLSLLTQLRSIVPGGQVKPALVLRAGTVGTPASSGFFNTSYNLSSGANNSIGATNPQGYSQANDIPFVIVQGNGSNGQYPPRLTAGTAVTVDATGNFAANSNQTRVAYALSATTAPTNTGVAPVGSELIALNTDLSNLAGNTGRGFAFVQDRDYSNIMNQPGFDSLWVTPVYDGNTTQMTQVGAAGVNFIEQQLQQFSQGTLCSLAEQGYIFQTYKSSGLGDLDIDAFYEHTFSDHWRTEVWLGFRLPTGGSNRYCGNPYRIELGNGNHFEVKIGGNVGWQTPVSWLALKADLSYAFVINATEKRAAAFKGSTVNNVGPCTPAEVDWGYLTGHFDFNFYHPKNSKLSTTIGYEIYYKTEDNVSFKNKSVTNHFLGQAWTDVDGVAADASNRGTIWSDYAMELDNKAAERDTERIAHRIRSEMHWHANPYWSLYAGGATTFAGKNIFRESDIHGGIVVRY